MAAAIDERTKAVFCESIGNPAGNIVDLAALAKVAHDAGVPLIVDNTVATPALCRPFEHGAKAEAMFAVLEGGFQIFSLTNGTRTLFGTVREGEISGLLPFSRMETFSGEGVTIADSRIASVDQQHFAEMLNRMPEVGKRLVGRMTDRVRESSRQDQQREKMLAGIEDARLSRELSRLRTDLPLDAELVALKPAEPDSSALTELYRELEFKRLLEELAFRRCEPLLVTWLLSFWELPDFGLTLKSCSTSRDFGLLS